VVTADRIVVGTAQWGMPYGLANRTGIPGLSAVRGILARAADAGITTLDTARAYGQSESVLGALVGDDPRFAIVTKVPPLGVAGAAEIAGAQAVHRSIDQSLAALRRSRLDAVLLHDPSDRLAAGGAAWRVLRDLRRSGVIGSLGISARNPAEAIEALDTQDVDVVQVAMSLLDGRLMRAGFVDRARAAGKGVFVRSVFLQGVAHLSPRDLPFYLDPLRPVLAAIARWARPRQMTVADACLLYMRDTCALPIVVGMESEAQLDANLRTWARAVLDPTDLAELATLVPDLPDAVVDPSKWPPSARG
jgi:aryl-alcohol dehydrogenase-like predicted oxidoreductase